MRYQLACFDLDGTLADNVTSSWQLFHEHFAVDFAKREDNKKQFFSGKIPYAEWALRDVELWKERGATKEQFIEAMRSGTALMPGARAVLSSLKSAGMKLALISGSVNIMLDHLLPDHSEIFDHIHLTELYFDELGRLSHAKPTLFDMEGKAVAMRNIAEKEGIPLSRCVFVGDHHNDVHAARAAGLSIAFNSSVERLKSASGVVVDGKDLRKILPHILIP
ncbi:MAG: HAD-IB family phosphatase [Nanoarchaeota archaeon]|nr:HAD-IB family phosphatase [Nanoarchaeota archaeon]